MSAYQVSLPVFEGPFDLLFHLIQEQKLDIYDIPIAKITAQYLDYIQMMEILDMEIASSFLVMAATLIEIKSKMLLPKEKPVEVNPDDEFFDPGFEEEDPRARLVEQMLEYKRFKEMAILLRDLERKASRIYTRNADIEHKPEEVLEINLGPIELLDIYHALIKRRLQPPIHRVVLGKLSILDRMNEIRKMLQRFKGEVTFARLLGKKNTTYDQVITFMSVLEMIKAGEIGCTQEGNFASIKITPGKKDQKEAEPEDYEEDVPDDVSKMAVAKAISKGDEAIKAIKVQEIPDELLKFKTPSEIEAEKRAAELAALAVTDENGNPVTPDLIASEGRADEGSPDNNIPSEQTEMNGTAGENAEIIEEKQE